MFEIVISDKYKTISTILFGFLDTEGKSWKQIFKTLTLMEALIKSGAERFIEDC